MKTTQTLEHQIAELTAKYNLQKSVEDKLPGFEKIYTNEFNLKSRGTKFIIHVYLDNSPLTEIAEKIQQVIADFPPTRNNMLLFAGKEDHPTASPFVLRFKNNIRDNKAEINYISGDYSVDIELPIKYYSDDCKGVFMRKVYDSEYHYFGGTSMTQIQKMQISSYKLDMFEECKYYGGDVVNFIESEDDKEEFESVLFKGHIPQFADFWQKQLSEL